MSIREEAVREAERRWPVEVKTTIAWASRRIGFELGAVWRDEQAEREPSDVEVWASARRLWVYDLATAGDAEGAWAELPADAPIKLLYYQRAKAVLLAAQEVRRG